jgi:hypothetical protein
VPCLQHLVAENRIIGVPSQETSPVSSTYSTAGNAVVIVERSPESTQDSVPLLCDSFQVNDGQGDKIHEQAPTLEVARAQIDSPASYQWSEGPGFYHSPEYPTQESFITQSPRRTQDLLHLSPFVDFTLREAELVRLWIERISLIVSTFCHIKDE